MSAHPNHGTKPQARKQMVKAVPMEGGTRKHIWKLRAKHDHRRILVRDGETLKFTGTEYEAKEWAEAFPGWEPTYV